MDRVIVKLLPSEFRARHGDEVEEMLASSADPTLDRADVVLAAIGLRLGRGLRVAFVATFVCAVGVDSLADGAWEIHQHWWPTLTAIDLVTNLIATITVVAVQRQGHPLATPPTTGRRRSHSIAEPFSSIRFRSNRDGIDVSTLVPGVVRIRRSAPSRPRLLRTRDPTWVVPRGLRHREGRRVADRGVCRRRYATDERNRTWQLRTNPGVGDDSADLGRQSETRRRALAVGFPFPGDGRRGR